MHLSGHGNSQDKELPNFNTLEFVLFLLNGLQHSKTLPSLEDVIFHIISLTITDHACLFFFKAYIENRIKKLLDVFKEHFSHSPAIVATTSSYLLSLDDSIPSSPSSFTDDEDSRHSPSTESSLYSVPKISSPCSISPSPSPQPPSSSSQPIEFNSYTLRRSKRTGPRFLMKTLKNNHMQQRSTKIYTQQTLPRDYQSAGQINSTRINETIVKMPPFDFPEAITVLLWWRTYHQFLQTQSSLLYLVSLTKEALRWGGSSTSSISTKPHLSLTKDMLTRSLLEELRLFHDSNSTLQKEEKKLVKKDADLLTILSEIVIAHYNILHDMFSSSSSFSAFLDYFHLYSHTQYLFASNLSSETSSSSNSPLESSKCIPLSLSTLFSIPFWYLSSEARQCLLSLVSDCIVLLNNIKPLFSNRTEDDTIIVS